MCWRTLGDQMTADDALEIDAVARGGGAADVLVSAAAGSPLLVVGSRRLGGFRRMLLGSVSLCDRPHCRVLSRINSAWWDVQWARTGPGWSRRTWQ
jgi:universal stress protein family protein